MASPPFLTNYFQILNLITTLTTTVTCYTLVPIYYPRDYFIRLNIFILVISFVFGTFYIIGKLIKSAGTNDRHVVCLKLERRRLMGCFAIVTVIGVVAKVWVFFIGKEKDLLSLYYHFTVFNIILLCFYTSAHSAIGKFQITYRPHTGIFFLGAIFHLLTLALAITIALDYKDNYGIIFFQAYYSFSTLSLIDFFVVLIGGIKRFQKIPKSMEVLRPLFTSECEICSQEYSDTVVIPRILTQCGHTVCEVCAGNLLDEENRKITCPICRQDTVVNGTVESLPKNFTVLQMARGSEEA